MAVTEQRARNAAKAKQRVDQRREDASGAAGWIAERAGEWWLEGVDDDFMKRQKFLWNPLMDYWFRMEIEGWEKLPAPPERAGDKAYVDECHEEVRRSIQDGMDALARRRAFPIFG